MTKTRLLIVAHSGYMGGAETVLAHAINNVLSDSSRYETDVYYPLGTGSLFRTALRSETVRRCCALPYRNIASGSLKTLIVLLYSLPTILWLIAVCLFRKTDRIYVNSAVNFPGAWVAYITGKRCLWHIHEQPNAHTDYLPRWMISTYRKLFTASNITPVFVTERCRRLWSQKLACDFPVYRIAYPPLKELPLTVSKKTGTALTIGYLGALIPGKNVAALVRSYARLHTSHPQDPPYLLICGSGPCLHELQDLARTLHVETFTEFRAFQNDVSGFFADIDMLVQPSLNESWGLTVLEAMSHLPIFGICLGHQMIALAYGAKTYKLKFGHRGGNHPVKNLETGKVEITSQNHSYAVEEDSLQGTGLEVTHRNLLDSTVEGMRCREDRVFSVQYHPESAPGPQDSAYLFDEFLKLMEDARHA